MCALVYGLGAYELTCTPPPPRCESIKWASQLISTPASIVLLYVEYKLFLPQTVVYGPMTLAQHKFTKF